jgi:hypothetical protein
MAEPSLKSIARQLENLRRDVAALRLTVLQSLEALAVLAADRRPQQPPASSAPSAEPEPRNDARRRTHL